MARTHLEKREINDFLVNCTFSPNITHNSKLNLKPDQGDSQMEGQSSKRKMTQSQAEAFYQDELKRREQRMSKI